jgi:hypothetical protein
MRKLDYSEGRECSQCKLFKPQKDFTWKDKKRLTNRCHECRNANYKENPHQMRDRAKAYYWANRELVRAKSKERRKRMTARALLNAARLRARKTGLDFNIDESDVVVPVKCPVLGIDLVVNENKCQGNSPTLDRIVPGLGYVRGNVRVISFRANTIKNDATLEELRAVVRDLESLSVTYSDQQAARRAA